MSTIINADTSDGLKFTSDTSGEIKLQSAGADIATVGSTGITMASGKGLAATGHVLQVVNAKTTTQTTSNSTSYADTALTASITPTSSSSKILIIANFILYPANAGGGHAVVGLNRGGTLIYDRAGYNSVGSSQITSAFNYLDTPSTTSATTYTCRLKSSVSGQLVAFGLTGYNNVITLMEIAG